MHAASSAISLVGVGVPDDPFAPHLPVPRRGRWPHRRARLRRAFDPCRRAGCPHPAADTRRTFIACVGVGVPDDPFALHLPVPRRGGVLPRPPSTLPNRKMGGAEPPPLRTLCKFLRRAAPMCAAADTHRTLIACVGVGVPDDPFAPHPHVLRRSDPRGRPYAMRRISGVFAGGDVPRAAPPAKIPVIANR